VANRDVLTTYKIVLTDVLIKYPEDALICLSLKDSPMVIVKIEGLPLFKYLESMLSEMALSLDSFFGESPFGVLDQTEIDCLDVGTQSSTWAIQAQFIFFNCLYLDYLHYR
jgi:hypothetical protein